MSGVYERTNYLGLYRLTFASLVIFAHSPEITDGDRGRELLTQIFGTVSFGGLAVDGFFVISGYLITASFLNSETAWSYLVKRALRIYPGFLAAYLVCVFVVGPLSGGRLDSLTTSEVVRLLTNPIRLLPPELPGVFSGMHYASLNGAMWTIAYEFRCYLLVAVIGYFGLLQKRELIAALFFLFLILFLVSPVDRGEDHKIVAIFLVQLTTAFDLHVLFSSGQHFTSTVTLSRSGPLLSGLLWRC